MKVFDLDNSHFVPANTPFPAEPILPGKCIVLERTPFTLMYQNWDTFWAACKELRAQTGKVRWVFVNACWDPVTLSNEEIQTRRQRLQEIFPESKICILSARAQHFYDNLPGCVYFPLFLMIQYPELNFQPRRGRIGCLNRRNAWHRVWLMHHLLDQKLIDPSRDVYSVSFTNIYTDNYWDVDGTLGTKWFNEAQQQWPKQIATHPDNFPCDYSIDHPAWHTGISIITETEPGANTIICEKTGKGILSKSCFSIHMSEVGYRVLEDLGFHPRFFPDHAEDSNIEPILRICREITTEADAMSYRQQHIQQIEHNFAWFALGQGEMNTRPWFKSYASKLQQALDSL